MWTLTSVLSFNPQFVLGLALIAIFWPASWLHWGILGEYSFFPLWLGYIITVDALLASRSTVDSVSPDESHTASTPPEHSPVGTPPSDQNESPSGIFHPWHGRPDPTFPSQPASYAASTDTPPATLAGAPPIGAALRDRSESPWNGRLQSSRPPRLLRPSFLFLFLLSAPSWWLFESGNGYTLNWHYLGADKFSPLHILVEASIDFSTVIPAVFVTTQLLLTINFIRRLQFPFPSHSSRLTFHVPWLLMYLGAFMYLAIMLFPRVAFPFLWLWLFLLLDPLNYMRGRPSLIEQFSRGDLRMIGALALGVLVCGFFWELWNFYSYPKWYYTVPYVGFLKIFEMPLLGYLGYIPFSWELYALYQYIRGILRIKTDVLDVLP